MKTSSLRQVLNLIQENQGPITSREIAKQLNISPAMADSMVEYWIRRGKISGGSLSTAGCSSCPSSGGCPVLLDQPEHDQQFKSTDRSGPRHQRPGTACEIPGEKVISASS